MGSILPGFRLALGFTIFYLILIVLIPLSALFVEASGLSLHDFGAIMTSPRVLAAFKLSFGAAAIAACVNALFGLIIAWVLVRYQFPLKKLFDAAIDLPFALPTAVAGVALTTLYSHNGWLGSYLSHWGIEVAYTRLGICVALIFVGLPFVVRTLSLIHI